MQNRPVVPDPGALQAFPFWMKIDSGDKPVSIVQVALRLEALKTRQRHLWPCPPVISGDGRVVAFRDQQSLYIVNASEPWEATKADDGSAVDTVGGFAGVHARKVLFLSFQTILDNCTLK